VGIFKEDQVMCLRFTIQGWSSSATLLTLLLSFTIRADVPAVTEHARLFDYVGSYETDQLLADPRVAPLLRQLAGDQLEHLRHNLDVRGSVDLVSGWLKLAGNAPHGGTEEEAVVCINPEGTESQAAIFSKGKIMVLTKLTDYTNLTLCIKDWVTQVNSLHNDRLVQPSNVSVQSH